MKSRDSTFISCIEDDGFEMNINVVVTTANLSLNEAILKELVELAVKKGFSRFVGVIEPYDSVLEWVFIFSKPDYFDNDDMLVANPIMKERIRKIKSTIN